MMTKANLNQKIISAQRCFDDLHNRLMMMPLGDSKWNETNAERFQALDKLNELKEKRNAL